MSYGCGLVKSRLQRNQCVYLAGWKVLQIVTQKPQTLLRGVIPAEEDAGIGRVVVGLVKRYKLFIGQIRDVFGIAA